MVLVSDGRTPRSEFLMKRIIICLLLMALSGCATVSAWKDAAALKAGYVQKTKAEAELDKTKAEYDAKLATQEKTISEANDKAFQFMMDKMQVGGNLLYGADFAFSLHPRPDRTHIIMDNKVNEARVLMPPPTVGAMMEQNTEVKKHLDETLTSLEDLKVAHELTLGQVTQLNDAAAQAQAELVRAKQEKLDLEAAKARELAAKQADLNKANDSVIAAEHERGNDAKARQVLLTKLSMAAGLLSVICMAGAIWSPVFKHQFGIAAAILAVAAVGIWYLTPLVVLAIVGTGILAVVRHAALKHNDERSTNTDLIRAVQRIKEKSPDVFNQVIKPELDEANTKYVKKDGEIVKVADPARIAFIDKRLAEVGDK